MLLPVIAQDDMEGCKDYPLFTRMPDFYIYNCGSKEFESHQYLAGYDDATGPVYKTVEGKYFFVHYLQKDNGSTPVSAVQIYRNYKNAFTTAGAEALYSREDDLNTWTFKFKKGDKEIWVGAEGCTDGNVLFQIIETEAMKQTVSVNDMLLALNNSGFYALYINFESGKYDIKPEFEPNLNQVVKLLTDNPDLKLSVEGHTDNTGTQPGNQTLSENRAKAVCNYLISKGISAERLSSKGWGQDKPVADNRTEEGRYKNRRVELVKK
jgi:outer membrane protein OmpA-like peptidoglycan-associated protein